jgi:hypothetical protein
MVKGCSSGVMLSMADVQGARGVVNKRTFEQTNVEIRSVFETLKP